MSLNKLPGIKGLVSTSHRKRRFRKDLTAEMISPPMGDFRHTMHVGRGGDVFGDTSFLSNHGGGAEPADPPANKTPSFFSRTLRHVRKTPPPARRSPPRLSPPPPPVSPIVKNAISLPRLDVDAPNGNLKRALFPSSPGSPEDPVCTYGVESGFATLPRLSRSDRQLPDCPGTCPSDLRCGPAQDESPLSLLRYDSMTSFTVDLGPSLMSEVFAVIDSPDRLDWEEKGEEEEEEEGEGEEESCVGQNHVTGWGSAPVAGRGRRWEEPEGDTPERAVPDVVLGMEAERFRQAADVLARHYGGGGISGGKRQTAGEAGASARTGKRGPGADAEEEEEIKV